MKKTPSKAYITLKEAIRNFGAIVDDNVFTSAECIQFVGEPKKKNKEDFQMDFYS